MVNNKIFIRKKLLINIKLQIFLILTGFLMLALLSSVSGVVETLGTFKQDSCIDLIQTCSNCSYNNLSNIIYPNGTILSINSVMTKSGTNYNYSFCLTNSLGQYLVYGFGDVNGVITVWAYDYIVTPTGGDRLSSLGIFTILILVSIALLGMAMMFRNGYVGFIAGCLFLVTGVYIMINGLGNLNDEWTRAVSYTILGMGLIFCVSAGMQIIGDVGFGIGPERDDE